MTFEGPRGAHQGADLRRCIRAPSRGKEETNIDEMEREPGHRESRDTLRFGRGNAHFFAFHYSGRQPRSLGNRFVGLKTHWDGSAVLLPPSRFVFGPPVTFLGSPYAAVLEAPAWLDDHEHRAF
jgi:hypothetical protein